jgi:hypothetical protein
MGACAHEASRFGDASPGNAPGRGLAPGVVLLQPLRGKCPFLDPHPGCASRPRANGFNASGVATESDRQHFGMRLRFIPPDCQAPPGAADIFAPSRLRAKPLRLAILAPKPSVAPSGAGSSLRTEAQRSRAGLRSVGAPHLLRLTATSITEASADRRRGQNRHRVPSSSDSDTDPEGRPVPAYSHSHSHSNRSFHPVTIQAPPLRVRVRVPSSTALGEGALALRSSFHSGGASVPTSRIPRRTRTRTQPAGRYSYSIPPPPKPPSLRVRVPSSTTLGEGAASNFKPETSNSPTPPLSCPCTTPHGTV